MKRNNEVARYRQQAARNSLRDIEDEETAAADEMEDIDVLEDQEGEGGGQEEIRGLGLEYGVNEAGRQLRRAKRSGAI